MRLTQQGSPAGPQAFEGKHVSEKRGGNCPGGSYFFIRAARIRSKIQIMSENKIKGVSGCFVICDIQKEYSEHLFQILSEQFESEYQFHLFHDPQKMKDFLEKGSAEILVIGEECGNEAAGTYCAGKKFILTGIHGEKDGPEGIYLFRYQSAEGMIKMIRKYADSGNGRGRNTRKERTDMTHEPSAAQSRQEGYVREKRGEVRIRDEPLVRGMIGIYSPVHRIGKTKFALHLGQKMARQISVLYLNLEGYSGVGHYFQDGADKDLGDLLYFLKQERDDWGLKLASMAVRQNGMDYIFPMKNEQDLRSVRAEEWIRLLDMIREKCLYEVIILDLGDAVCGLYDILRKCDRIYTLYICEGAAEAKMEQYEENLRAAGYADILAKTVKKRVGKGNRSPGRSEEKDDKNRTAV